MLSGDNASITAILRKRHSKMILIVGHKCWVLKMIQCFGIMSALADKRDAVSIVGKTQCTEESIGVNGSKRIITIGKHFYQLSQSHRDLIFSLFEAKIKEVIREGDIKEIVGTLRIENESNHHGKATIRCPWMPIRCPKCNRKRRDMPKLSRYAYQCRQCKSKIVFRRISKPFQDSTIVVVWGRWIIDQRKKNR